MRASNHSYNSEPGTICIHSSRLPRVIDCDTYAKIIPLAVAEKGSNGKTGKKRMRTLQHYLARCRMKRHCSRRDGFRTCNGNAVLPLHLRSVELFKGFHRHSDPERKIAEVQDRPEAIEHVFRRFCNAKIRSSFFRHVARSLALSPPCLLFEVKNSPYLTISDALLPSASLRLEHCSPFDIEIAARLDCQ